jgi:hypothetical protein
MAKNLIEAFFNHKNIPVKIGEYYFCWKQDNKDGCVQLRYEGEKYGYFTVTIYNYGAGIPDDLEDPMVVTEFERCINKIIKMEGENYYQNINLLIKEPFFIKNEKEPKYLSAIFNYDICMEKEEYLNEVSFLFIRSDNGYFNVVQFSVPSDNFDDAVVQEMNVFLIGWLNYVPIIGDTIN